MSTPNLLQADQLSCVRQQTIIFEDLSFDLNEGELLLVEGANGSGKSSLLRLLTGLATPSSGDVYWKGKSIASDEFRDDLHYVGHANGIKLGLTVAENLSLFGGEEQFELLATTGLGLESIHDTLARSLSAGQKRKLALARLFLFPKKCWILDEPLTALDVHAQKIFLAQLETHLANGGMAVMSSHQTINVNAVMKKVLLRRKTA